MRILLLGASGYVGGVLYRELGNRHDVVGTCGRSPVPGLRQVEINDAPALRSLAQEGFDLVIHAAGVADLAEAEADPERAWASNVASVETLVAALAGMPTRMVLFSSDNVFGGTQDSYTEADPTDPINAYGRSKVAAEQALAADPRHLALRIPIVFGKSPWSSRFMDRFAKPQTPAQTDVVCAPVYLFSLPGALEQLWEMSGVVQYAGPDVVTRYELMTRIQARLGLPTSVVPVRNDDAFSGYRRPKRLVLRSVRHQVPSPSVDEALDDMARR